MKHTFVLAGFLLAIGIFSACKKDPGSGGTSSITGQVTGRIYDSSNGGAAEAEETQITIPNGDDIADGEYVLLNTPANGTYYYIWFKWNNGVAPDPALAGRTAIQVVFDFTETNLTVAANVANAIETIAGADFDVSRINDIVTVTNKATGEVPDAEEQTSNVTVDISNQGKDATAGNSSFYEGPIADERVFLVYGEEEFYSEDVRTDADGKYQFKGLNRGDYTIYILSEDVNTPKGVFKEVKTAVTISSKKEVVDAGILNAVHL